MKYFKCDNCGDNCLVASTDEELGTSNCIDDGEFIYKCFQEITKQQFLKECD